MAYGTHAAIPTVALAPNTAVTLVPYDENDYQPIWGDSFVTAWAQAAKTTNLSVQDFWGFTGYSEDMPSLDVSSQVPQKVRLWRANGMKAITNESTGSSGAMGLPWYLTGQLAWNTKILDGALLAFTFDAAFGPLARSGRRNVLAPTRPRPSAGDVHALAGLLASAERDRVGHSECAEGRRSGDRSEGQRESPTLRRTFTT